MVASAAAQPAAGTSVTVSGQEVNAGDGSSLLGPADPNPAAGLPPAGLPSVTLLTTVQSGLTSVAGGALSTVTSTAAPVVGAVTGLLHGTGAAVQAGGATASASPNTVVVTTPSPAPAPAPVLPALPPVSSLTGAIDSTATSTGGVLASPSPAPTTLGCLPLLGCLGR